MEAFIAQFIAFILSLGILPSVIATSHSKKLFDMPHGRKRHKNPTPSLGGISIFFGFFLATTVVQSIWPTATSLSGSSLYQSVLAATFLIFVMGIKDDLCGLGHRTKFIGQIVAALFFIFNDNLLISNLNGLFGLHSLPLALAVICTLLAVLLIVNAYNLIDGIDGLSASLSVLSLGVFALAFTVIGETTYAIFAAALLGATISFLIYNWHPAKLFMGDSGSLLLGLCHAIFALKMYNLSGNVQASAVLGLNPMILAVTVMFVPIFDTIRVFAIRLSAGQPPFVGDRNHIHHILIDMGLSAASSTMCLVILNASLIVFAISSANIERHVFLALCILFGISYSSIIKFIAAKKLSDSLTVETTLSSNVEGHALR
jgi:UDP-N-acetylmuramyl pentapeptide phosphotransferase/UDP-N-acetylglucosamine-1-phosphate transferase